MGAQPKESASPDLRATPTLAFLTQESQPGNPFLEGNHWPDSLYQHPDIVVNYKHTGPT